MLEIRDVRKSFQTPEGPLQVLKGVDLDVASGEGLAMTGESGSGKSTLLHAIAGLEPIDSGTIRINGAEITRFPDRQAAAFRRQHIGIVFQQFNLISSLSIAQNIHLQARLAGKVDDDWIVRLSTLLGLDDLLERFPEQLSGGQQQRAAIARALALRPNLVLADEPTGNLDAETGDTVMQIFLDLIRQTECAFVMVTHNPRLAALCARQIHLGAGRFG